MLIVTTRVLPNVWAGDETSVRIAAWNLIGVPPLACTASMLGPGMPSWFSHERMSHLDAKYIVKKSALAKWLLYWADRGKSAGNRLSHFLRWSTHSRCHPAAADVEWPLSITAFVWLHWSSVGRRFHSSSNF